MLMMILRRDDENKKIKIHIPNNVIPCTKRQCR